MVDGHTTETPRDNDAHELQRAVASITASPGAALPCLVVASVNFANGYGQKDTTNDRPAGLYLQRKGYVTCASEMDETALAKGEQKRQTRSRVHSTLRVCDFLSVAFVHDM